MFEIYKSEIKDFRVITVCTGGIRCEKATLYMNENGLPSAVQLDGGILDYLNKTEANHWNGECFVFENTKLKLRFSRLGIRKNSSYIFFG